jgi:hypothetical protein
LERFPQRLVSLLVGAAAAVVTPEKYLGIHQPLIKCVRDSAFDPIVAAPGRAGSPDIGSTGEIRSC